MHWGWFSVDRGATIALLAVVIVPPGKHLASVRDGEAVKCPNCHVNDPLASETLHHCGFSHVLVRTVAKSVVVSFAPGPNQA